MKNLTLLATSSIIGLALAEGILRLAGFHRPIVSMPDEITGNFHRPNIEFLYTDEGHAEVQINRFGERDREHQLLKPDRSYRIAILGDSYAEAFQVNVGDTFWAILERRLNSCSTFPRPVEVLNFGVSGYGTGQELLTLRHRVWSFAPDLVILAFLTGNDIRNNSKELELADPVRPFFFLDHEGRLQLDDSFKLMPAFVGASSLYQKLRLLADYSRLVQLASLSKSKAANMLATHVDDAAGIGNGEFGLDDHVYLPDAGNVWREAWKVTEALLAQMHREVAGRKGRFVVATLSNGIQVSPDPELTNHFMRSRGIEDIFLPDRRIAEIGKRHGFQVISLAPTMQRIAVQQQIYLHGFGDKLGTGHWNENGHRVAGDLLFGSFCG